MKYYAVIDTNVLVSAMLKWNSVPGNIMELVFSIIFPKVGNVINEIDRLGLYLNAEKTNVILPDPKDTVFYEIVMEKRKTEDAYLVTGNIKHFPSEPFIVTPREMMTMIVNDFSD